MKTWSNKRTQEKLDSMMRGIVTNCYFAHKESLQAWEASGYNNETAMHAAFMYLRKLIACEKFLEIPWGHKEEGILP